MEQEAIEKWILEAATKNAHEALAWLLHEMNIDLSDDISDTTIEDEEDSDEDSDEKSYEI